MLYKMASIWSGDCIIADHKDLQATAFGLNRHGTHAILAGRRNLAVIDLDNPNTVIKGIIRSNKWEVGAVHWSPTSENEDLFALSCNHCCELFAYTGGSIITKDILQGHTRVISDLDWHKFDPNLLATASIDTYIYVWDVRQSRKPAISMSAVASATQVKWNRLQRSGNNIATSHEGDLRLWDIRKANCPTAYVAAHLSKIHNLDWSPFHSNVLVTSSQDCTVKFFDINNTKKPASSISTCTPVWRAKFTPFRGGLVTAVVPQLRQGDTSVVLWNVSNLKAPIHSFLGHTDVVLVFDWRKKTEESNDYHLVTWSKDHTLRIWKVDSTIQKNLGLDPPGIVRVDEDSSGEHDYQSETGDDFKSVGVCGKFLVGSSRDTSPQDGTFVQPKSLLQEFSLMSTNIPNITVKSKDVENRTCSVLCKHFPYKVFVQITFPLKYPLEANPSFSLLPDTKLKDEYKTLLLESLEKTSSRYTRRNHCCLEPCLWLMTSTIEDWAKAAKKDENGVVDEDDEDDDQVTLITYGFSKDFSVPFPRSSGARFCGNNVLVCFGKPSKKKIDPRTQRSRFSIGGSVKRMSLLGSPSHSPSPLGDSPLKLSIQPPYYYDRPFYKARKNMKQEAEAETKSQKCVTVIVYDLSSIFPMSKELASRYVIKRDDIVSTCHHNATVATSVGRKDLVQLWTLVGLIAGPLADKDKRSREGSWVHHPFGRQLLEKNIEHYLQLRDMQTVAMLVCVFGTFNVADHSWKYKTGSSGSSPGGSPYHTVHLYNPVLDYRQYPKQHRSNSWSETSDDIRSEESALDTIDEFLSGPTETLLDPKKTPLYDSFKQIYADILYRWGLFAERALVLKYVTYSPDTHKGMEFVVQCPNCLDEVRGPQCSKCKTFSFRCSVCKTNVRGSSNFCLSCGHGGHSLHLLKWFDEYDWCPAGCGCHCLAAMSQM